MWFPLGFCTKCSNLVWKICKICDQTDTVAMYGYDRWFQAQIWQECKDSESHNSPRGTETQVGKKILFHRPCYGGFRESNSGPLAPEASIMPLNQIPGLTVGPKGTVPRLIHAHCPTVATVCFFGRNNWQTEIIICFWLSMIHNWWSAASSDSELP